MGQKDRQTNGTVQENAWTDKMVWKDGWNDGTVQEDIWTDEIEWKDMWTERNEVEGWVD